MARQTNAAITYDDANYMIDNEGFSRIGGIISGLQCMTKADIEAYMNADPTFFSSYVTNRLVPYHLINPVAVDTTPPPTPSGLTITWNGTVFIFNWNEVIDDSGDQVSYLLYSDAMGEPWGTWGVDEGDGTRSLYTPEVIGCWTISAVDSSGNESAQSTPCVNSPDTVPPTPPSNLRFREEFTPV